MNKAVANLLAVAVALMAKDSENDELQAGIDALNALGDKATHSNGEYKSLKTMVEAVEEKAGSTGGEDEPKRQEVQKPKEPKEQKTPKEPKGKKDVKYKMDGIRMIGSKYYSKKDGYKKAFGTAVECAKKFNEPKE